MDSPPDCSALSQPPSDPTPSGGVPRETLDVEDDSARQDRLGALGTGSAFPQWEAEGFIGVSVGHPVSVQLSLSSR